MTKAHDKIIAAARKRIDAAASADQKNRERSADDLAFLIGERQWDEEIKRQREADGKPCLTVNRLPQFVRQVTGQIRDINPAITVVPGDNEATKEVAEIYAGLIRQIESACDASSIYEGAAESAAACGIGAWRVRADYCDPDNFDQEILIERVPNPFSLLVDPAAKRTDRSDAQFMFLVEDMALEDFEDQYPDAAKDDIADEHRPTMASFQWTRGQTVTVAEYFWIEHDEYTLGLMEDGTVVKDPPAPLNIKRRRKVRRPYVQWAKITGGSVLEGPTRLPCSQIPVFVVTGEEWNVGEDLYRSSVIRFAKTPQQLFNYMRSTSAEVIALQPRAPYMVTPQQVKGLERHWAKANQSNLPYLPYNPDPNAPPPQRATPPVASQGIMTEMGQAIDDLKATTGVYDASLGNRSNETSGVAIARRQMESQNSTSSYADNMVKAIRQCGKVMIEMIPQVYDTERTLRILGDDDNEKQVMVNQIMMTQQGPIPINDLRVGKYDLRVTVGPSYDTKREAAAAGMMEFIRAFPQAAQMTGDLIAKSQDWPDADRFAERLRKAIPPQVIGPDDMTEEEQQQAQAAMQQQQQMQQMQMQLDQMKAQLDMAEAEAKVRKINADAGETEIDAQKRQLEVADMQIDLAAKSGQLDAIIQQAVQQALMQVVAQQRAMAAGPF